MSPFALLWIAIDVAALVVVVVIRATRATRELRPLLVAQAVVLASAVVAWTSQEPLHAYAEWTLMVAVNLGYALTAWTGGASARFLSVAAVVATTLAVVLITLKAFSSIIVIAIGLVFAIGSLFAALLHLWQFRAQAAASTSGD